MKITEVNFITSGVKLSQYPEDALPEIALAGRSNVGKSSLINAMINRKKLAHTSSRPGKTQTINFFSVNNKVMFADVPGYGYAKVSKVQRAAWGRMLEAYFTNREPLRSVIQIVDLRHAPSQDDVSMYRFLKHHNIPVIIVATKADKITKGHWQRHLKVVKQTLHVLPSDPVILFSSETKVGRDELWGEIMRRVDDGSVEGVDGADR
ncbi:GTP-binding protein [Thermoactinomyces sp. DSM 45891]|uniref:ribosome biogenesis GTP-binding protein YihA/YsxC n=1 Tax=Thermoactinomyces sp. DSM 45891 TaxID=1761907 RepID=UPI000912998B|nr:ribosome biogenesis GTP-binding protein YihA/YsxC [Thermoactinomyces sp. DSM 45891]SFX11461.1 GTP-binding protein [Thermoactinomyces sp. DSM 45891]